jgi:hypothetical protein
MEEEFKVGDIVYFDVTNLINIALERLETHKDLVGRAQEYLTNRGNALQVRKIGHYGETLYVKPYAGGTELHCGWHRDRFRRARPEDLPGQMSLF